MTCLTLPGIVSVFSSTNSSALVTFTAPKLDLIFKKMILLMKELSEKQKQFFKNQKRERKEKKKKRKRNPKRWLIEKPAAFRCQSPSFIFVAVDANIYCMSNHANVGFFCLVEEIGREKRE